VIYKEKAFAFHMAIQRQCKLCREKNRGKKICFGTLKSDYLQADTRGSASVWRKENKNVCWNIKENKNVCWNIKGKKNVCWNIKGKKIFVGTLRKTKTFVEIFVQK